jgi:hypothetical protein
MPVKRTPKRTSRQSRLALVLKRRTRKRTSPPSRLALVVKQSTPIERASAKSRLELVLKETAPFTRNSPKSALALVIYFKGFVSLDDRTAFVFRGTLLIPSPERSVYGREVAWFSERIKEQCAELFDHGEYELVDNTERSETDIVKHYKGHIHGLGALEVYVNIHTSAGMTYANREVRPVTISS